MTTATAATATTATDNPCLACTIQQDCCTRLSGLRVTQWEFDRCFAQHADLLDIAREGPVFVLTPKGGQPCPNWKDGGCSVYDIRPRECRLFRFTLCVRSSSPGAVSLGYHCDTQCRFNDRLRGTEEVAASAVAEFGREAFGMVQIEVRRESRTEFLRRRLVSMVQSIVG